MSQKVLLWDFDGTLGFRKGGMWSSALLEALQEHENNCKYSIDDIKPHLKEGFPWHQPDVVHTELNTPKLWWENLKGTMFVKSFVALGYSEREAGKLADLAHQKYVDVTRWSLYVDVLPTLQALKDQGWNHAIVSNRVPELDEIVHVLGLSPYISEVINSAVVGYEKPHPEIYKIALEKTNYPKEVWMIGDNIDADVKGAETVGIKGILVRKRNEKASRQCEDLTQVLYTIKSSLV